MSRFPDGMAAMRARQAVIQAALRERIAAGARRGGADRAGARRPAAAPGLVERPGDRLALYLSPNTVKTHIQALYRKLGAHSREDAVGVRASRPS